jgi:hypothetical protein
MFDIFELNLTRSVEWLSKTDHGFLLYRIDMAIVQENAKACVVADAGVSSSLS